jgi:hypothetical protein
VLNVDRRKHKAEKERVRSTYRLIKDVGIPLMTEETARSSNSRRKIARTVRVATDEYIHVPGSDVCSRVMERYGVCTVLYGLR